MRLRWSDPEPITDTEPEAHGFEVGGIPRRRLGLPRRPAGRLPTAMGELQWACTRYEGTVS